MGNDDASQQLALFALGQQALVVVNGGSRPQPADKTDQTGFGHFAQLGVDTGVPITRPTLWKTANRSLNAVPVTAVVTDAGTTTVEWSREKKEPDRDWRMSSCISLR